MAERSFRQFINLFEARPVMLFANISIGASGAPTLNANSRGIKSVTRNSAGDYSIALEDKYTKLLEMNSNFITSTGTDAALEPTITSDSSAAAVPLIRIVYRVAAGTATDPSNGAIALIKMILRNSSAPI